MMHSTQHKVIISNNAFRECFCCFLFLIFGMIPSLCLRFLVYKTTKQNKKNSRPSDRHWAKRRRAGTTNSQAMNICTEATANLTAIILILKHLRIPLGRRSPSAHSRKTRRRRESTRERVFWPDIRHLGENILQIFFLCCAVLCCAFVRN